MVEFSFKGEYTLREINGTWYIYDRNLNTTKEQAGNTFKKARAYILKNYDVVEQWLTDI